MKASAACRAIPDADYPCPPRPSAAAVTRISPKSTSLRARRHRRRPTLWVAQFRRAQSLILRQPGRSHRGRLILFPVASRQLTGYVRDPFGTVCGPPQRDLYARFLRPKSNSFRPHRFERCQAVESLSRRRRRRGFLQTISRVPTSSSTATSFDTRVDYNATEKDQVFARFSYVDDPQYIPGPFGGVADGGAFQQGIQTAKSVTDGRGLYPRLLRPHTVNQVRGGFAHLHTTRFGPDGGSCRHPDTVRNQ